MCCLDKRFLDFGGVVSGWEIKKSDLIQREKETCMARLVFVANATMIIGNFTLKILWIGWCITCVWEKWRKKVNFYAILLKILSSLRENLKKFIKFLKNFLLEIIFSFFFEKKKIFEKIFVKICEKSRKMRAQNCAKMTKPLWADWHFSRQII